MHEACHSLFTTEFVEYYKSEATLFLLSTSLSLEDKPFMLLMCSCNTLYLYSYQFFTLYLFFFFRQVLAVFCCMSVLSLTIIIIINSGLSSNHMTKAFANKCILLNNPWKHVCYLFFFFCIWCPVRMVVLN